MASEFLSGPDWGNVSSYPGWEFEGIDVLTLGGQRIGIHAKVIFGETISMPGTLAFVRCGSAETWKRKGPRTIAMRGVLVQLMDGDTRPWQVLPLDGDGRVPSAEDMRSYVTGFEPCP